MAINVTVDDLPRLNDKQLQQRVSEALAALGTISASILKEGIIMLLLEQNRRATNRLRASSRRLEWLTYILMVLTAVLTWKELVH